jgi:hypothetical protein
MYYTHGIYIGTIFHDIDIYGTVDYVI